MALRTIAADLVRMLDAAGAPVYVLDEERRLVFANQACAAWAGYAVGELLGHEARYHSSGEVTGPAAVAAALAPPPEVWTGRSATVTVALAGLDSAVVSRLVNFLPLAAGAVDVAGVIALASAVPVADEPIEDADDDSLSGEQSSRQLHEQLARYRRQFANQFHVDRLVGPSPQIRQVRSQVELATTSAANAAIIGPTGSGRQHVARAIHYGRAPRSAGSLVPLVCPLLSASLLESTIRGLSRATAAAESPRPAALLLCDADQLPGEAQEYLARALSKVGGVRVLATSRESFGALAAQQKFRSDLACALSTIEIRMPPLAERLEDLPLLAQMLLEDCNRLDAKQLSGFTPEAIDRLAAYSWPANVDELAEVVAAAHQAAEGSQISSGDLPAKVHIALDAAARPRKVEQTIALEKFLAEIEEELIRRALTRAKGNKTKAARLLGMTRPRLYRRLVQLGLEEAGDSGGQSGGEMFGESQEP